MSIPAGTTVSCCMRSTHFDADYYDDPDTFNPFRFSDPPPNGTKTSSQGQKQVILTGPDFLSFGHGRHAWWVLLFLVPDDHLHHSSFKSITIDSPGRFFAAAVLKMLLAHIVITYDVKFEEGKPLKQFFINGVLIPGRGNVMFRKRSAKV